MTIQQFPLLYLFKPITNLLQITLLRQQSDIVLLHALQARDKMALKELHDKYFRLLWLFAYRILKSKEQAEDIAMDTFIRLWTANPRFSTMPRLESYLFKITKNLCIKELERKNREKKTL